MNSDKVAIITKEDLERLRNDISEAARKRGVAARAMWHPELWRWWMCFRDTRPYNVKEHLDYDIAEALYCAALKQYHNALKEFAEQRDDER